MAGVNIQQALGSGGLTLNSVPGLSFSPVSGPSAQAVYNVGTGNTGPSQMPKGQVLGAATTSGGGGGGGGQSSNPHVNPATGNWDDNYFAGQQSNLPSLDSLYAPIFDSYNQTQKSFEGNRDQNLQDLQGSYDQNTGLLPGYEASARNTLQGAGQDLYNSVQSAYGQAARNYNSAKNAAIAQYGGGNGAAGAMTDLAQQEYARETGGIGQAQVQGQTQMGTAGQDITNWVNQQHTQLNDWLSQAKEQVNGQFSTQLAALNSDRNATEAQKAAGKISLLEDVMNQNNALAQADTNFRRQLALVQAQAGQIGGQQFNTAGFMNQLSGIGAGLGNYTNPANQSMQVATGNNQNPSGAIPGLSQQASQKQNNDWVSALQGITK